MDHVAILRKSKVSKGDDLLGDIIKGKKTIESRWYVNRIAPWDKIEEGDMIYFKKSGGAVKARAQVSKVIQYRDLNKNKIREIMKTYGKKIFPHSTKEGLEKWAEKLTNKRYCILVFLQDVVEIKPFNIDKTGYGISSAWMCVGEISNVRADI
jgi:ASC-1-like (ASCH) protein